MKITTKGCYGMRAMIELAIQTDGRPMSMEAIADQREISRKYLHALLTSLRSAGLVRSVRGPGGGYALTRPAQDITIREILKALEGPLAPSSCTDEPALCDRSGFCPMLGIWNRINEVTEKLLDGITLADVTKDEQKKKRA